MVLEVERELLRERIEQRFHAMLDAGWLEETRWLDAQQVDEMHPAVRAVGYRQLLEYLHGNCSLDKAVADGITATRRYAKRQQTWFRNQTAEAVFGDADSCFDAVSRLFER
jgi:tRNA dimethylallyltransferase